MKTSLEEETPATTYNVSLRKSTDSQASRVATNKTAGTVISTVDIEDCAEFVQINITKTGENSPVTTSRDYSL